MEYEIRASRIAGFDYREILRYRELFLILAWRDIKVKYKQTFLGIAWAILQPLSLMAVFSLFLANHMKGRTGDIPYPVFVYSGLMLWGIFSSGVVNASNSMIGHARMIKKIYFPRLIVPSSSLVIALFDFAMTFVVYVLILIYYHFKIDILRFICFFPLSILLTVITTLGAGILCAAANVRFRDFRFVVPFAIQFLFFLTPIIYPVSLVGNERIRYLLLLNPMASAISLSRGALLSKSLDWSGIGASAIAALAILALSMHVFKKTETYCADLL